MEHSISFDRMRDWCRGAPAEDAASIDERARELLADFRFVHQLTTLGDVALHAPRLSFDELERAIAGDANPAAANSHRTIGRSIALAASLALLAAAGFWWWLARGPDAEPLRLEHVRLETPAEARAPLDVPASWSDYDPRGDDGVRWIHDVDEALELARLAGRPVLVYGGFDGCPLCAALDRDVFASPRVAELARRAVPLRVDMATLPKEQIEEWFERGYPVLEVWGADRTTLSSLPRAYDADLFASALERSLGELDGPPPPDWSAVRACSASYAAARRSERDGEIARAEREFADASACASSVPALAHAAIDGVERLAGGLGASLLEARDLARVDRARAIARLEHELARSEGSRFEGDVARALRRLRDQGSLPMLVDARGSRR